MIKSTPGHLYKTQEVKRDYNGTYPINQISVAIN